MHISESDLGRIQERILEKMAAHMEFTSEDALNQARGEIRSWLRPLLTALPEGTTVENLNAHGSIFFSVAEELLLQNVKNAGSVPLTISDDELRSQLNGVYINRMALLFYSWVYHGMSDLSFDPNPLSLLADNFSTIDLNKELRELIEAEGNNNETD